MVENMVRHHTEEHKLKISIARRKQIAPMLHKNHSLETRKKMSKTRMANREKLWNWKGGIVSLRLQICSYYRCRKWKSDILARDNFTCQLCGANRDIKLEVDHYPKRFSEIVSDYHIKTLEEAMNCEAFYDMRNGRTLCKKCHRKINNKLTESDVIEIKKRLSEGEFQKSIANRFNVSSTTISMINRGKNWKGIT